MTTDAARKRRLAIFGGGLLVAIVAVAIVIAVSSGGSDTTTASTAAPAKTSSLKGVSAIKAEFAGIPQTSNVLGNPKARATMMVFADMQCPFCAEFENNAFPSIVEKYVKPGKLKVVFQPIVILGNDSILGARAAAAAGQQNKLFEFTATLYRNQGQENTGYLNQAYVKKIASGVAGLDAAKLTVDLKSAAVNKVLNDAQATATSGKVESTPSFFVAKTGASLQQVPVTSLEASAFYKVLDAVTA
jgi:protein-disulfide isomerase